MEVRKKDRSQIEELGERIVASLVLSCKCGEKIVVPEQNLIITVVEIRGDRVRLGIAAPSNVTIHRQEVWQRIQQLENGQEAAYPCAPGLLDEVWKRIYHLEQADVKGHEPLRG